MPWLQDRSDVDVWSRWGVGYRDVIILDETNSVVDVYNLTEHDLAIDDNYAALKALLANALP